MKNFNLEKLDTKEKMLILKAILEMTKAIYKDNADFILNQVMKSDDFQIQNDFGMFYKKVTEAKTVKDKIEANKNKIEELLQENEMLSKEDKDSIVTEERVDLMSKCSAEAEEAAEFLLDRVIKGLQSKRISKSAQKVKRG
jgi:hypothetical protein